jgi:hypothetical protein
VEQPFSEVRIIITFLQKLSLGLQWSSLSPRSELDSLFFVAAEPWPPVEQPFSEVRIIITFLQQLTLGLQWSSLSQRSELKK